MKPILLGILQEEVDSENAIYSVQIQINVLLLLDFLASRVKGEYLDASEVLKNLVKEEDLSSVKGQFQIALQNVLNHIE